MAIPHLKKQDILSALRYIDEHGTPANHQSTRYELVTEGGTRYPPKYVIAVAAHLAHGMEITTEGFHGNEARRERGGRKDSGLF